MHSILHTCTKRAHYSSECIIQLLPYSTQKTATSIFNALILRSHSNITACIAYVCKTCVLFERTVLFGCFPNAAAVAVLLLYVNIDGKGARRKEKHSLSYKHTQQIYSELICISLIHVFNTANAATTTT